MSSLCFLNLESTKGRKMGKTDPKNPTETQKSEEVCMLSVGAEVSAVRFSLRQHLLPWLKETPAGLGILLLGNPCRSSQAMLVCCCLLPGAGHRRWVDGLARAVLGDVSSVSGGGCSGWGWWPAALGLAHGRRAPVQLRSLARPSKDTEDPCPWDLPSTSPAFGLSEIRSLKKKYFFVLYLYDEGAAWKGNYFSCSVFTFTLWVDLRALILLKSCCRSVAVLESSLLALHPPHAVSFSSPFRTPIRVVAQLDGPQSPDTGREGSSKWSALSFPCCAQNSPRRSRNLYLLLSSVSFPLSLPQPFLFQSTSWGLKLCWAAASLWECPAWLELLTRVPK